MKSNRKDRDELNTEKSKGRYSVKHSKGIIIRYSPESIEQAIYNENQFKEWAYRSRHSSTAQIPMGPGEPQF